jgi:hypothetical protein
MATFPEELRAHLFRLVDSRAYPKTICPSEVARALSQTELQQLGATGWRDTMPMIRELAWQLRESGEIEILQKGERIGDDVELENIKGPIRLRKIQ